MQFRKPMGAVMFAMKRLRFPCFIQPKLDGIRCVTDGRHFWSRNGNEFPKENTRHLWTPRRLPFLVDGELMLRDENGFEDLASVAKRAGHPEHWMLQLNVFDVMTEEEFVHRLAFLDRLFTHTPRLPEDWLQVATRRVASFDTLRDRHKKHLKWGREGSIVRLMDGLYVPRKSTSLIKYKPLMDAEFRIVGIKEAKGKDKRTPVFICEVGRGGPQFSVRPKGTVSQRKSMWYDGDNLMRKMLTVEFANYTKYGIPRHPRAKVPRDYE